MCADLLQTTVTPETGLSGVYTSLPSELSHDLEVRKPRMDSRIGQLFLTLWWDHPESTPLIYRLGFSSQFFFFRICFPLTILIANIIFK